RQGEQEWWVDSGNAAEDVVGRIEETIAPDVGGDAPRDQKSRKQEKNQHALPCGVSVDCRKPRIGIGRQSGQKGLTGVGDEHDQCRYTTRDVESLRGVLSYQSANPTYSFQSGAAT